MSFRVEIRNRHKSRYFKQKYTQYKRLLNTPRSSINRNSNTIRNRNITNTMPVPTPRSNRGRPRRDLLPEVNHALNFSLDDIIEKPDRIQLFDSYSRLPKLFMTHLGNTFISDNYKKWFIQETKEFDYVDYIVQEDFQCSIEYPNNVEKQGFYHLMTILLKITKISLRIKEDIFDFIMEVLRSFSNSLYEDPGESTKRFYFQNPGQLYELYRFFDRSFFEGLLEVFNEWKGVYFKDIRHFRQQ